MERQKKIALAGPYISQKEIEYVVDAAKNGWYETYDMHIKKLEETFAHLVGARHAIATFCGTHALHLAALALDLKDGDEVILPDISCIASAFAISYTGAKCVFVDIDPETLCIDPEQAERAITPKTKAIMAVDFSGYSAEMDEIKTIAARHNLKTIEDACQAVGSKYRGRHCGTTADIGCYSFQGSKICVGGEGGMLVTDDDDLYEKALHYGTFCRNDAIRFLWSDDIGYGYRISNITAALILAQVERLDELIARKKMIFEWYEKYMSGIEGVKLLRPNADCTCNYSYAVCILDDRFALKKERILIEMLADNVHMRPGYPPMSLMPNYERHFAVPNADHYFRNSITLPTAMNLTEDDISYVCARLDQMLREK